MAGIYIHVPFCVKRCLYCDFYSGTDMESKEDYIDAVCKEIALRAGYLGRESLGGESLGKEAINTIYFGGGTPSQLSVEDFSRILQAIKENFNIENCTEITLEANPDDLSEEYLSRLRQLPFNRISIGVQSFKDDDLKSLNRRH